MSAFSEYPVLKLMVEWVVVLKRLLLQQKHMPLNLNQPAPDFTLYDTTKKQVSLHDFRGKTVVLLFFPFAFSSTCTKELCELSDSYAFYKGLDAEILGISVDSLYTNAKFKEVNQISFRLLSDFNKAISAAYDSLIENFAYGYHGVSKRATFVIDKNGNLAYSEILASPGDYPDMPKLRQIVASLK
ncbi:MAG: peroxiredoxin [Chitinophagales bacterium]